MHTKYLWYLTYKQQQNCWWEWQLQAINEDSNGSLSAGESIINHEARAGCVLTNRWAAANSIFQVRIIALAPDNCSETTFSVHVGGCPCTGVSCAAPVLWVGMVSVLHGISYMLYTGPWFSSEVYSGASFLLLGGKSCTFCSWRVILFSFLRDFGEAFLTGGGKGNVVGWF